MREYSNPYSSSAAGTEPIPIPTSASLVWRGILSTFGCVFSAGGGAFGLLSLLMDDRTSVDGIERVYTYEASSGILVAAGLVMSLVSSLRR